MLRSRNLAHPPIQPRPSGADQQESDPGDDKGGAGPKTKQKRTHVTLNACRPCQKRKSKCDGLRPICSACTDKGRGDFCTYDYASDLRRTTALKQQINTLEVANTSLEAILLYICDIPGASSELGLVPLIHKAVGERDVGALAELAQSLLQRRRVAGLQSTIGQSVGVVPGSYMPGPFQQQVIIPPYTAVPNSFVSVGVGTSGVYSTAGSQVYDQMDDEEGDEYDT